MPNGHGYYNLAGEFVETATLEEATAAWRTERGYSTGALTTTTTPAANLAQTFIDRSAEVTPRPGVTTTSIPSLPSWWGQPTGGGIEPVATQPGFVRRPVAAPTPQLEAQPLRQIVPPLSQSAQTTLQQTALSLGLNTFGQGPQQNYNVQAIQGTPETPSISVYRGPTGQVGPNEIVVQNLADVLLTERTNPGANIFYANPRTGELEAKAGIMAFVPALMQYLDGKDMPDSVVQILIDLGLLDDSGAVTAVGDSLTSGASGGRSIFNRTSFLTGSPGRFSGTRGAALGLVNWRI